MPPLAGSMSVKNTNNPIIIIASARDMYDSRTTAKPRSGRARSVADYSQDFNLAVYRRISERFAAVHLVAGRRGHLAVFQLGNVRATLPAAASAHWNGNTECQNGFLLGRAQRAQPLDPSENSARGLVTDTESRTAR